MLKLKTYLLGLCALTCWANGPIAALTEEQGEKVVAFMEKQNQTILDANHRNDQLLASIEKVVQDKQRQEALFDQTYKETANDLASKFAQKTTAIQTELENEKALNQNLVIRLEEEKVLNQTLKSDWERMHREHQQTLADWVHIKSEQETTLQDRSLLLIQLAEENSALKAELTALKAQTAVTPTNISPAPVPDEDEIRTPPKPKDLRASKKSTRYPKPTPTPKAEYYDFNYFLLKQGIDGQEDEVLELQTNSDAVSHDDNRRSNKPWREFTKADIDTFVDDPENNYLLKHVQTGTPLTEYIPYEQAQLIGVGYDIALSRTSNAAIQKKVKPELPIGATPATPEPNNNWKSTAWRFASSLASTFVSG